MPIYAVLAAFLLLGCAEPHQNRIVPQMQPSPTGSEAPNTILHHPLPPYPFQAMKERRQGTVTLRLVVSSDCQLSSIEVLRSSGHKILDDAAMVRGVKP
jgi:outer membrane biosynthesis protein TonB